MLMEQDTILVMIQIGRRRVYQLSTDKIWWWWRGKLGWQRVHSEKTLIKLKGFEP